MAPGAPPTKSTATATNKMIMGGRYQESKHTGSFMGMPFEGFSLVGYDNAKKIFVTSWIDNMGTGMMFMEGKWDDKTKTNHFTGKSTDPAKAETSLFAKHLHGVIITSKKWKFYDAGRQGIQNDGNSFYP